MSNKQSSIEWLFLKLWETPKDKLNWHSILKQAKAMHKEEIVNSWMATDNELQRIAAEHYYNEMYGGNNEQ